MVWMEHDSGSPTEAIERAIIRLALATTEKNGRDRESGLPFFWAFASVAACQYMAIVP